MCCCGDAAVSVLASGLVSAVVRSGAIIAVLGADGASMFGGWTDWLLGLPFLVGAAGIG